MKHQPPAPQAILNALRRMVSERTQWDEPPEVGFLYREASDAVRVAPVFVHPFVWEQAENPKNVLRSMIQVLALPADPVQQEFSDTLRNIAPADLCGMYLRTEGWAPPKHRAPALFRRHQAGHAMPHLADMPDRVETRLCVATDTTGRPYMAQQERDQPELTAFYEGMSGGQRPERRAVRLAGAARHAHDNPRPQREVKE